MNGLVTAVLALFTAAALVRGQSDRVDNKYLDPNDYFSAGGDQQDRRRVQDAFNR